jgi:hypothetical protein
MLRPNMTYTKYEPQTSISSLVASIFFSASTCKHVIYSPRHIHIILLTQPHPRDISGSLVFQGTQKPKNNFRGHRLCSLSLIQYWLSRSHPDDPDVRQAFLRGSHPGHCGNRWLDDSGTWKCVLLSSGQYRYIPTETRF